MFEEWRCKNFQRYRSLRVSFAPGVNTIVGDTDKGKSTIVRGLYAAAMNGSDANQTTFGEAECRSQITFDGGRKVLRQRTKTENLYKLDGDKPYVAFGTGVPATIKEALSVSDLNFQFQADGFFWLSLSPPERAREINKIFDLSDIDSVAKALNQECRQAQDEVKLVQSRLGAAKNSVESLQSAKAAASAFRKLRTLGDAIQAKDLRVAQLQESMERLEQVEVATKRIKTELVALTSLGTARKAAADAKARVTQLEAVLSEWDRLDSEISDAAECPTADDLDVLSKLQASIVAKRARVADLSTKIEKLQAFRAEKKVALPTSTDLEALEHLATRIRSKTEIVRGLRSAVQGLQQADAIIAEIQACQKTIDTLRKELDSVAVCGECGRPL